MIKTTNMLLEELNTYASPNNKIGRMVQAKELIPIVKGLYETNSSTPGYLLAGSIYGPSYLSFDFALGIHGLIPEAVYAFTSATFEKKKKKQSILEAEVMRIMEKSLKTALDMALDDILKYFK